ncbi:hypothetical protein D7030_02580 [Flavobacteriaceae bacterium AU392]|nr:hypothetical protein D1817_09055 [Flavobacteriaceae bacterium]RKM85577.1 hypothetical protein D7030_02580 [Flavobacteriaceae bacterium AU392]
MKNLKTLGRSLNKNEQKQINGGEGNECFECLPGVPPESYFACAGSDVCQIMPDGCHICV